MGLLDTVTHRVRIIEMNGESYRLKDKRQSGLLTSLHLLSGSSQQRVQTHQ